MAGASRICGERHLGGRQGDLSLGGEAHLSLTIDSDYFRPARSIAARREKLPRCGIRRGRHVVDAGGIDPGVVEVEESAHRDGIVEGVICPARCPGALDILNSDLVRRTVHHLQKIEESPLLVRDRRGPMVREYRIDEISIPQKLSRDRGMGTGSETAFVTLRGEGRNQFP